MVDFSSPLPSGWTWPNLSRGMEWGSVSFGDRKASVTFHLTVQLEAQNLMWAGDVTLDRVSSMHEALTFILVEYACNPNTRGPVAQGQP